MRKVSGTAIESSGLRAQGSGVYIAEPRAQSPELSINILILVLVLFFLCSCATRQTNEVDKLRLGYLLNMTHAAAIVGIESAKFSNVESQYFSSGGYLLNALITGNLDIAYIGPGPYLNAKSKNMDLHLLKLSSIGANSLILPEDYKSRKDFTIGRIAVPQLGNTQDLLAKILVNNIQEHNKRYTKLSPDMQQMVDLPLIKFASDLEFIPVNPAELETAFFTEAIDAALVAEPWGTILESRGMVNLNSIAHHPPMDLIDELEGSPNSYIYEQLDFINRFPAALLVVKKSFYDANKSLVDDFVKEQDKVMRYIRSNKDESIAIIQDHLHKVIHKRLAHNFIASSFDKVEFSTKLNQARLDDLLAISYEAKYIR